MRYRLLLASLAIMLAFSACKKEEISEKLHIIELEDDYQTTAQEAMITMEDYDTIHFRAGTYSFNSQLSIAGKKGIVIRGEGRTQTILDFSGQLSGAQAILADNMCDLIFADLTIQDSPGDCIKVKDTDGLSFIRIGAVYTGDVSADNGAYGLYPVTSERVWVEDCYVRGASDAGIYVGQSMEVIVSNNTVEECVAGIEIENCIHADVHNNVVENNTGGILIFDLPNLPVIRNGNTCRIYDNTIVDNNHANFAPPGNIVGNVPPGTGVMILAARDIEIFNNAIEGHKVLGVGIVSYLTLEALDGSLTYDDPEFDPFVYNVFIHDNNFVQGAAFPADPTTIGFILSQVYVNNGIEPDIVYDGVSNPDLPAADQKFCIDNNGSAVWANVDAVNFFTDVSTETTDFECTITPLTPVDNAAPKL